MSKIKVVLFDIGNVLMLADHRRAIENFVLWGIPRAKAEGYFQRPDCARGGKGQLDREVYCQRLRNEWGWFYEELDDFSIGQLHASHIYALDRGTMQLIESLHSIPVGFVTNTMWPEWERYVEFEQRFADRFKTWRSDQVGAHKADSGVPESIIDQWIPEQLEISVSPGEVLFVDDNQANCEAFARTGAQVFQYTEREPWGLEIFLREIKLLRTP